MSNFDRIGLGGGGLWCTEAIFQQLTGVVKTTAGTFSTFLKPKQSYKGVLVEFDTWLVPLEVVLQIHLNTHSSTKDHRLRWKFPSAIYTFSENQKNEVKEVLEKLQNKNKKHYVTEILPLSSFDPFLEPQQGYYKRNPTNPFSTRFIDPKLTLVKDRFENYVKTW